MARSLTVKHEENPRASVLFMVFVALCCGLLIVTWATVAATADTPDEAAEVQLDPSR